MKTRNDFVTNSSSSSFIVSKKDCDRFDLLRIIYEIIKEDCILEEDRMLNEEEQESIFNEITLNGHWRYIIKEYTKENPYEFIGVDGRVYKHEDCFVVDNDGNMRYNWYDIDRVMNKHNISYISGYCD